MCRLIPALFFSICFAVSTLAQGSEITVATLHYTMEHLADTTRPGEPVITDMIMYLGKNSSLFTSYTQLLTDERIKKWKAQNPDAKVGGMTSYWGAPISFFKDFSTDKFESRSLIKGNNYLVEEKIPKINWVITTDKKNVGNYPCQKATASFHGRAYEAWFCSSLPFSNGPWKLGGLPGLILEAFDTKREIIFTLKSFEDTSRAVFTPESSVIKTTSKELGQAIEALQNEPPPSGAGVMTSGPVSANGAPLKKKRFNNPIDKEQN